MRVTHFSSPVFIDGVEISGRKKYHLDTATILGAMATSYWPLEAAQGESVIVTPGSDVLVVYTAGNSVFTANPILRIGYPDALLFFGPFYRDSGGSATRMTLGLDQETSQFRFGLFMQEGAGDVLTTARNKPLVASFDTNAITFGPITASTIGNPGSGYSVGNDLVTDFGASTIHVATVDGSGRVLTYSITDNEPEQVGIVTTTGGDGTGFTLNITAIAQGNGSLDLYFSPEFVDLS